MALQAVKQMYVLVLGLDVLGNPFGLLRGLSEGIEDLFYEPYQVKLHVLSAHLQILSNCLFLYGENENKRTHISVYPSILVDHFVMFYWI